MRLTMLALVFFVFSCQTTKFNLAPDPYAGLADEIDYLLQDPNIANAHIGIYIERLHDGKIVYRQNEYRLFVPASNMKLYTSAAALENLGPDYRFKTFFYTRGEVKNDTLFGDLIIRGGGDPTFSGRFWDDDISGCFKAWADSLKKAGISHITGDVIGDASFFQDNPLGYGWNWDDEPYWYAAQIGALSFNDNCIDLKMSPSGKPGDSLQVNLNHDIGYVEIVNNAKSTHPDSASTLSITRKRGRNSIKISGVKPLQSGDYSTSITVEDPAQYFVDNFVYSTRNAGISVAGKALTRDKPLTHDEKQRWSLVFINGSPPLKEIIKVINKPSHNFYAEQTLRTLGAEIAKEGSGKAGAKAVTNWLGRIGVSKDQALIYDGSGLARHNMISPFSTAALLRHMYNSKNFDHFYESLPIAGVDGTLSRRMKNSPAEARVRAKTGYVGHVRCLSGYASDAQNNDYLFVMMMNHYSVPTPYINKLQDKIAILISSLLPAMNREVL